ncbi:MAG: hypothetical protein WBR24_05860 [Desulfobacterales bacterium]|jgi:hypothetical protein
MKRKIIFIILLVIFTGCVSISRTKNQTIAKEAVLKAGMTLCATSGDEKMCIFAEDDFKRIISWDGVSRSITLVPRNKRWHGLLGLVSPDPPDNNLPYHEGITRAIVQEAQIELPNIEPFYKSVNSPFEQAKTVYRDDGLGVKWYESVMPDLSSGGVLDLMVFQILINGKKPEHLIGSRDDKITLEIE